jgi:colanic acid/amylovoran biosynthesis glycosyltransferase
MIALVVPSFPKLSETFIVGKFLGLLDRGWDVHVVCGRSDPAEWMRFPELQRPCLRARVHVGWPHRPRSLAAALYPAALLRCWKDNPAATRRYLRQGLRRFGASIFRWLYLDAELIRLRPALIHVEFGALAVDRMHLKELLGCKVIVSFRGYDLNYVGLTDPAFYQSVWEKADAVHLLGEDLWRRAQRRGCPPDLRHALIPPAIDPDFFDPGERQHVDVAGTPARPLRILSVGRLDWTKGYEFALQAVKRLVDQGVHCEYVIVGDGEYLEPIAFARHQLGLEHVVRLLGAQDRSQVKAQMLQADVFLHAAVSEGFCNAVMEAQAMMVPVVCSDAGGLGENVVDGETGFVVPRRDPDALAEKLIALARDPDLRQRFGEAGRARVCSRFRLDQQIDAFDQLYRQVLMPDHRQDDRIGQERALAEASSTAGQG